MEECLSVFTCDNSEELENKYQNIICQDDRLSRKNVSFQANKNKPFYRWFSYKEGFSSELTSMLIAEYPNKEGIILDPFAGSGTTLFSASEEGFHSVGFELLPIGEFVFNSRKAAEKCDPRQLREAISKIKRINFKEYPSDKSINIPEIPITKGAYPPDTKININGYLSYLKSQDYNPEIYQILKFACFCILEKISFTRKDGQYLRWDKRSGRSRTTFHKGKIFTFEEALYEQLDRILEDILKYEFLGIKRSQENSPSSMKTGSCFELIQNCKDESVDLIITSPPYCNRYDYTRTYALELTFLGIDDERIKNLRQQLLSCTVENKEKYDYFNKIYADNYGQNLLINAENSFNSCLPLQEILKILEKLKNEKKLNNNGIYRMIKNYFFEHSILISEFARILKPGGRIYYVNDNVRYAGVIIPVDLILSEFAEAAGLKVKEIRKLQRGKGNSSQQMGNYGREEIRKCVYYWEK
ncbi:site-specific DNA-methyltransferase [Methanoplanus endosymbiosus]|uniref:site-specific DNA-methyltransferase (cytosine-N(4)-specific) n=1 Tax=Methanoplanus endosymbiosus TaxID=33865 RepID=A0A9E7TJJ3_9EURY|nr:site-specific DNA-methyltransferase [Methanoplanus endosymbiosus]UUX91889.1 site-specific DNA-methyltransferase [Methanoplanus endosymbiosus]